MRRELKASYECEDRTEFRSESHEERIESQFVCDPQPHVDPPNLMRRELKGATLCYRRGTPNAENLMRRELKALSLPGWGLSTLPRNLMRRELKVFCD
jgi:hypothetical protein